MKDIYFFIGTKAQAIKCLPLINKSLETESFNVYIVDSGQHVEIVQDNFEKNQKMFRKLVYSRIQKKYFQHLKRVLSG